MILTINDQEYFIIHKAIHKLNAIKKDKECSWPELKFLSQDNPARNHIIRLNNQTNTTDERTEDKRKER